MTTIGANYIDADIALSMPNEIVTLDTVAYKPIYSPFYPLALRRVTGITWHYKGYIEYREKGITACMVFHLWVTGVPGFEPEALGLETLEGGRLPGLQILDVKTSRPVECHHNTICAEGGEAFDAEATLAFAGHTSPVMLKNVMDIQFSDSLYEWYQKQKVADGEY